MSTAEKALAIARGEIGYNRWDDPLEGTKYGRWYAGKGMGSYFGASGVPYCNMFTSYVLDAAGVKEPGPGRYAYVPYCINDYRAAGRGVSIANAQPGDLICFDWDGDGVADHIGFIEKPFATYVQTIEGNTSGSANGSQANGGGVYQRTRSWDGVVAVLRPAYQTAVKPVPSVPAAKPGVLKVDGVWGADTTRALQRINGTPIDGVVSSQDAYWKGQNPGLGSGWEWVADGQGSQLIAKMQKAFGVAQDGLIGPGTIKAMQAYYGTPQDGRLDEGSPCIKAMQTAINRQLGGK